jgi:purine-binding chemotaxis protein CheW
MAAEHQYCTFYLDRHYFGLDVLKVQEIIRYQEMTRVPLAPPEVRGLINLRGQIVTAVDLRRRLELSERPADQLPVNVVVRTVRGAARQLIRGTYKLADCLLLILAAEEAVQLAGAGRD